MKKAAFFDIDGTLFRNSLLIEHFRLLTKYKVLPEEIWYKDIKPLYQKYQNRQGAYEDYLEKASILYQQNLVGIEKNTIRDLAKVVIEENKNKTYMVTRKAVLNHIEEGYLVFFISGSPDYLVKDYAKLYGAEKSIATQYIFDENDKFTGKINPMWDSRNKRKAINYLKETYNLDLSKSHAYGDTNGDFTMFEEVGFAHAINPSFELIDKLNSNQIVRNKTTIHVERKDVNYNFELKDMKVEFKKF
ncbi:MAG: HAD-IB family hydrolase [Peptoniphilaceae bacterium]|nr:HAD-IB family hydrolase [Peptoniphilaceae bacterium]MDY6019566.1 HAD-IB family hydrolase [Anaerococcus sp.]